MINFSFSSVLMTVLMSGLLLGIVAICFRKGHLLADIGYKMTFVFCAVGLLRFLIPLELPFTQTLRLPKAISDILIVFTRSYGTFWGVDITFGKLFGVIWVIGSLGFLLLYIHDCKSLRNMVKEESRDITSNQVCADILSEVCSKRQQDRIHILLDKETDTPMIMGLWNPVILLPYDVDLSDTDTLYALRHEIYHYMHHDIWIKAAVKLLVIIYWWNPVNYILKRYIDMLLEMRVDNSILSDENASADDYVTSLLHFARGADQKKRAALQTSDMILGGGSELHHRIKMITHRNYKPNRMLSTFMLAMVFGAYILSYCYIWEVYYTAPEVAENNINLTDDNCYAIINEDGLYDIYLIHGTYFDDTEGDFYLETVDTLDYFPMHMKIYSSEEEYHEEEP